jgi:hypothetical protein
MKTILAFLLFLPGILWPLAADVVYDNTVNDLQYRFPVNTQEIGDEIVLGGTNRVLTYFQFEYWGFFPGDVDARVRFYRNDLLDPFTFFYAPGTVLFDSGFFPVIATARLPLIFDDFVAGAVVPLNRPVPDSFTWTIQFRGLGSNDTAGVDVDSPPVVGTAFPDYWERSGADWLLKTNANVPVNFAVLIHADPVVPTELTAAAAGLNSVTLSWLATRLSYRLEESPHLGAAALWSTLTNEPVRNGPTWTVTLERTGDHRFFRLVNP